jgi:molybdopterin converting factor small subunit
MGTIVLPTPFRAYVDHQKVVEIEADTVGAALQKLISRYPALAPYLYDSQRKLRPTVSLFLRHTEIRSLRGEETPFGEGERLIIATAVSGGSGQWYPRN